MAAFFIGGDGKKLELEENEVDPLPKKISVRLQRVERLLGEQQAAKKS